MSMDFFAKILSFCYYSTMTTTIDTPIEITTEDSDTLAIQDESQFHNLVDAEREKHPHAGSTIAYEELAHGQQAPE